MKVMLWQDVAKVGKRGDVVNVKDGYFRNFLLPRKLAREVVKGREASLTKEFELAKRRASKQEAALVTGAKEVAEKLSKVTSVSVEVNTNEEGHLYGAVTPSMIADALRDQGLKVEPKSVEIAEPIKQVGTYEVVVNLHREVQPKVKVWVLSTKAVKVEGTKSAEAKPGERKPDAPPPS